MKYLIVVDMQRDFIDGALGTDEAVDIVPKVKDKIEACRDEGWSVIFTRDSHQPDYLQTQEGRNLPVSHCIIGTVGWEISPELDVGDSLVLDKPTFGSVRLASMLAERGEAEEIQLVGLCTDICVLSNAILLKAAMPEVPISVDASCCAGVTPASHKTALEAMKMCQIKVI
ncbi:MAG: cysteine hydrolase [Oscillospiraceae bacterium]|nr:cysteine hydrolase [Oscillospiraceae bacterium]